MYDLLNDAVSSYDGGPTVLNCWMMLNNELLGCETGGPILICGTVFQYS